VRFATVGVVNTAVGMMVIYASQRLGAGTVVANFCGYTVGLMVSFFLNRRWTFQHDGRRYATHLRFIAAFVVAYAANLGCVLLAEKSGATGMLAQFAGIVPYTVTFYLLCRHIVFPNSSPPRPPHARSSTPVGASTADGPTL
jgi:putative flippase GtrA